MSLFLFPTKHLHQCPIAAVTVYHKLSDLKWQMYSLTALEVRGLKSRCQQGRVPFGGSRSESVPFQLLVEWAPCHSDLCFCYHNITFPSLTLLPLSYAYKGPRDYVITWSPVREPPHLKILNLIISIKSLVPCDMMYSQVLGIGDGHFGGGALVQPTAIPFPDMCKAPFTYVSVRRQWSGQAARLSSLVLCLTCTSLLISLKCLPCGRMLC